jgi:uncharacterized protein
VRCQQAWVQSLLGRKLIQSIMKILVTGSTGLVGKALVSELKQSGQTVWRLVRPETRMDTGSGNEGFEVRWNPETGELGAAAVGADVVVNLAGASIAHGRWTAERKRELRGSRVETTRSLVNALAKMAARPRVLVSASAIGYYGDRGDEVLTEESPAGVGRPSSPNPKTPHAKTVWGAPCEFLSEVARAWEAEAEKAEALGIRVVRLRFGVILAKQGGALPQMSGPFRFGVGGRIASGQQWMSWISLEDVVAIIRLALENGAARGPVNVVAPEPVRNAEFTAALAKALRRPALLSVPAFALRLALGEMADALLLSSQRVVPLRLEKLGYQFVRPDLGSALAAMLS